MATRPLQAEKEASEAEDQLLRFQKSTASAKRELEQLAVANRRAQRELLVASSWGRLAPGGSGTRLSGAGVVAAIVNVDANAGGGEGVAAGGGWKMGE